MKILKLTSQNVKRLSVVEITPDGALVVVAGKNGAGKSSVLDSIMFALAGGKALPDKPVRNGHQKAKVKLDLGDLVVTRTFTAAGGTSLTVQAKDGMKYPSPQAVLDALTGRLSFDPLEFAREKPLEQAQTLSELAGLNFAKLDQQHEALFAERTLANRHVKQCQANLATLPAVASDEQLEPVSVTALLEELRKAVAHNQKNREIVVRRNGVEERLRSLRDEVKHLNLEIERLQVRLDAVQADVNVNQEAYDKLGIEAAALKDIDTAPIQQAMAEAEKTNQLRNRKQMTRDAQKVLKEAEAKAAKLDRAIEENRASRAQAIRAAKYPVEGLALGESGVMLNGIPFAQCSTAEQLKVSVAMGLAMNPKLKVLLIRNGNDLDKDNLTVVGEMAAKAEAQVWIERVEETGKVSVIIEDGHVKGVEPEPAPDETEAPPAATKPAADATEPKYDGKLCPDCGRKTAIDEKERMRYCTGKCGWWQPANPVFANPEPVPKDEPPPEEEYEVPMP